MAHPAAGNFEETGGSIPSSFGKAFTPQMELYDGPPTMISDRDRRTAFDVQLREFSASRPWVREITTCAAFSSCVLATCAVERLHTPCTGLTTQLVSPCLSYQRQWPRRPGLSGGHTKALWRQVPMRLLLPFLSGNFSYQSVSNEPWKLRKDHCPAGMARNYGLAAIPQRCPFWAMTIDAMAATAVGEDRMTTLGRHP